MRLLLYVHDWAPTLGGIQTVTQVLARGLSAQGDPAMDVTLTTMTPTGGMDDSALNGCLNGSLDTHQGWRVVRCPTLVRLFRLIYQSDVIHVAGPCLAPIALSLLLRKPVVVEHHGFQAICPNGQLLYQSKRSGCSSCPGHFMSGRYLECFHCNSGRSWQQSLRLWFLTFLRRGLTKRASANIVPTNYLGGMLRLPRTREIPHGLPPAPIPSVSLGGGGQRPATFLFVGRLVSAKGPNLLLRAAARLRTMGLVFRVTFIGDGLERTALEAQSRALGLAPSVIFRGAVSAEDLERAWADSTALVMPSLAGEVFGLVVVEAMLRGKPVIVPAYGALAEVAGDAALTFSIGDDEGLAGCMRRCLEQPGEAVLRGANGCRRADLLFNEAKMIREHARLYAKLAEPAQ
jgi:glycosyltransferase involved in cell wall biosynthesis